MGNNRTVTVRALQRGQWVIKPGDLVRSMTSDVLRPGEVAKVLRTYYLEIPIKDTDQVMREGWLSLEIVKTSSQTPLCVGLQISEKIGGIVPADYVVGHGIGNGGRTFDQFVLESEGGRT